MEDDVAFVPISAPEHQVRKLVAVVAADIAGYSRLISNDEAGTVARLEPILAIAGEISMRRGGRIVSTAGDGFLAEFASVREAVFAAVEIQQSVIAHNAEVEVDGKMLFRIGVNVGDVILRDQDIFGDGVNIAARLQTIAEPGQICVSRSVRDHLRDKSPLKFEDMGELELKNLIRPVRVFRVSDDSWAELPPPMDAGQSLDDEDELAQASQTELAFWNSIAANAAAGDYEAYLSQYPHGSFATLAQARLDSLSDGSAVQAPEALQFELTFWESIVSENEPSLFQAYLEKYPNGHFKEIAEIKVNQLANPENHLLHP